MSGGLIERWTITKAIGSRTSGWAVAPITLHIDGPEVIKTEVAPLAELNATKTLAREMLRDARKYIDDAWTANVDDERARELLDRIDVALIALRGQ